MGGKDSSIRCDTPEYHKIMSEFSAKVGYNSSELYMDMLDPLLNTLLIQAQKSKGSEWIVNVANQYSVMREAQKEACMNWYKYLFETLGLNKAYIPCLNADYDTVLTIGSGTEDACITNIGILKYLKILADIMGKGDRNSAFKAFKTVDTINIIENSRVGYFYKCLRRIREVEDIRCKITMIIDLDSTLYPCYYHKRIQ